MCLLPLALGRLGTELVNQISLVRILVNKSWPVSGRLKGLDKPACIPGSVQQAVSTGAPGYLSASQISRIRAVQRQKAITAYMKSKQLPPFDFARQYKRLVLNDLHLIGHSSMTRS